VLSEALWHTAKGFYQANGLKDLYLKYIPSVMAAQRSPKALVKVRILGGMPAYIINFLKETI